MPKQMQLAIIIHHTEIDIYTGKPNLPKAIKGIEIHICKPTLREVMAIEAIITQNMMFTQVNQE